MDRESGRPVGLTRVETRLLQAQRSLGVGGLVAVITGISIVVSLAATTAVLAFGDGFEQPDVWVPSLITAAVVPSLVAPPASLFSCRLTSRLDDANHRLGIAATTDPLTGVLNRRGFFAAVRDLSTGTSSGPAALMVGMVDLDLFKQLNDRYGHDAGDRALIHLAGQLASLLGPSAVIGRLGGDEFAFVVPDPDQRPLPPGGRWEFELGPDLPFSATVGTTRTTGDENVDLALSRADASLYRSRHLRRRAHEGSQGQVSSPGSP